MTDYAAKPGEAQAIIPKLVAGDVMTLLPGTHPGIVVSGLKGEPGKPITIRGAPGGPRPVIDRNLAGWKFWSLDMGFGAMCSHIVVENLHLIDSDPLVTECDGYDLTDETDLAAFMGLLNATAVRPGDPNPLPILHYRGGLRLGSGPGTHHVSVHNVSVGAVLGCAIECEGDSLTFDGVTVENPGSGLSGYGAYCKGSHHIFKNFAFHGVVGYGIHAYPKWDNGLITGGTVVCRRKPYWFMSQQRVQEIGYAIAVAGDGNVVTVNALEGAHDGAVYLAGNANRIFGNRFALTPAGVREVSGANNECWGNTEIGMGQ